MALTSKERAALRSEAHHLDPLVHVGQAGVTPEVIQALDEALKTRELVKIQLVRTATATIREAAGELASATGCEVVQTIGKRSTLYRYNPDLHRNAAKADRQS